MPTYRIGEQRVRRKNFYIPCAIAATIDDKTEEEKAAIYKKTYWADNITNAEWPVVLEHEEATKSNRSRLKKKAAGWLMALSRIAYLNPDLYNEIVRQAKVMYLDQIGQQSPMFAYDAELEVADSPQQEEVA